MTSQDNPQRTVGGLGGKAVDKVKEVLGEAGDSEERARDRQAGQVAAEHAQIEQDPAATEHRADARAANEHAAADVEQARERVQAERSVRAAEDLRVTAAREANRLERIAHEAERRADRLDTAEEDS